MPTLIDAMLYASVAIVVALPLWWAYWVYRMWKGDR